MSLIDNLDKEEKEVKPKNPKDEDDGTQKVPTSMLETLQKQLEDQAKQIKKLEARQNKEVDEDDDDEEAIDQDNVRLREFEPGKLVIGYNKTRGLWNKYDKEQRKDFLMIELIVMDDKGIETTEETKAQEFFENAKEIPLPVIRREEKKHVIKTGTTTIKAVPEGGYKTVDTGKRVAQKVTIIESKVLVDMPSGKQIFINADFLNM